MNHLSSFAALPLQVAETPSLRAMDVATADVMNSAEVLLRSLLHQFAQTFLLNEESNGEQESQRTIREQLPMAKWIPSLYPRRRDSAVERLHHSRVGLRRLRSSLSTFHKALDEEHLEPLGEEIRWLSHLYGARRDLDVLASVLLGDGVPIRDPRLRVVIQQHLLSQRDATLQAWEIASSSTRYRQVTQRLRMIDRDLRFVPASSLPADRLLRSQLRPVWKNVRRAYRDASEHPTNKNLHALRIKLKHLQYASEVVSIVPDIRAEKLARVSQNLQSKLGSVHDAAVAEDWLRKLAFDVPIWSAHLVELAEFQRSSAALASRDWRTGYERVRRRWHGFKR